MSEDEFKSVHYVFCNKKCENQRSIPKNFTSVTLTTIKKKARIKNNLNNNSRNSLLTFPISIELSKP